MGAREKRLTASTRRAEKALISIGEEIHHARLALGASQTAIGASVRMSQTKIARIESGNLLSLRVTDAIRVAGAVGLDLSIKLYVSARRPRDAAQLDRLIRLLHFVALPLTYRTEAPLPSTGPYPEQRAWDALIEGAGERTGVELEVKLYDIQAQTRRIFLKQRDGGVDHLLVVVADTRANRQVLALTGDLFKELPRLATRDVIDALQAGRHPPTGMILF